MELSFSVLNFLSEYIMKLRKNNNFVMKKGIIYLKNEGWFEIIAERFYSH